MQGSQRGPKRQIEYLQEVLPISTSRQNSQIGENKSGQEALEANVRLEVLGLLGKDRVGATAVEVIGRAQYTEDKQRGDLEHNASECQVVASLLLLVVRARCGRDPSACALQDERQDVAADEDPSVIHRSNA